MGNCQILNPLSKARDGACIFMDTSRVCYRWATAGTPIWSLFWYFLSLFISCIRLVHVCLSGSFFNCCIKFQCINVPYYFNSLYFDIQLNYFQFMDITSKMATPSWICLFCLYMHLFLFSQLSPVQLASWRKIFWARNQEVLFSPLCIEKNW